MNFNLGNRKIQKTSYSYLCPLPPAWAKNAKLDQSSSVSIELMADNSLRITPSSAGPARSKRAECTTPSERTDKEEIKSLANSSDPSDEAFATFIEILAGGETREANE